MKEETVILGIDTSCDDTSASVVREGKVILSNVVSSQGAIHSRFGGIVPELASRRHVEVIWPVVEEALKGAGIGLTDLSAVAVTYGPGLIGSLLVGCMFAKAVCFSRGIPLMGVNHLEGHVFASFLLEKAPEFPFLSLVVSGGHTALYQVRGFQDYVELGRTRDDAAGEAYDKVSKMLGLGYPGGPLIDKLAKEGDAGAVDFPRPYLPGSLDFSFSGLKTAVRNFIQENGSALNDPEDEQSTRPRVEDICASFQGAVVDVLVRKTEWAIKKTRIRRLALSGGVAANSELRASMEAMAEERQVELYIPPVQLCTDNAAMIAAAGHFYFREGRFADMKLNPRAHLPLGH